MASASNTRKRKNNDDDPSSEGDKKRAVSTSVPPSPPAPPSECFLKFSFFAINSNNPVKTTQQIIFACLGGIVNVAAIVDSYISPTEMYYRWATVGHPPLRKKTDDEVALLKEYHKNPDKAPPVHESSIFPFLSFRAMVLAFEVNPPLRLEHFLMDGLENGVIESIRRWKASATQKRYSLRVELMFMAVKRHGPQSLLTAVKEGILDDYTNADATRVFAALFHFKEADEASSFCKENDEECKGCQELQIDHVCETDRERIGFENPPYLISAPLSLLIKLKKKFDFDGENYRPGLRHLIATGWRFDVLRYLYSRFPEQREALYRLMILSAIQKQYQPDRWYTVDAYLLWYLHNMLGYPYRHDLVEEALQNRFGPLQHSVVGLVSAMAKQL